MLGNGAYCFTPGEDRLYDCVVRVEVDGAFVYEDKVKRDGARALGVVQDGGGLYVVDRLELGGRAE